MYNHAVHVAAAVLTRQDVLVSWNFRHLVNRRRRAQVNEVNISLGLPMILMGDEVRRTQHGNNNAYCQDNETSWFDWTLLVKHADVHRFVKGLCGHRLLRDFEPDTPGLSLNHFLREARLDWHGVKLARPDWSVHSHSLAASAASLNGNLLLYLILNAYWEPLEFELPPIRTGGRAWRRWIDTNLDSPDDVVEWHKAPAVTARAYLAGPRSVVALFARGDHARPSL
jgi:glycogen operon protein